MAKLGHLSFIALQESFSKQEGGSAIDSLMIMKQTALVLCVAFGLLLLTLEAEGGRLTLEEVGVGVNDVKTIAGDMDNKVAESDSESSDSKGGATHRLFPDVVKPKEAHKEGDEAFYVNKLSLISL
ncbi:hypothetical protein AAG906_027693 [Vitis piasezkii]